MEVKAQIVRLMKGPGSLRAYAKIDLDGEFMVHSVRIIEGPNGIFAAMPSEKGKDSKFRDICHPITADLRTRINDAVRKAYDDVLNTEK